MAGTIHTGQFGFPGIQSLSAARAAGAAPGPISEWESSDMRASAEDDIASRDPPTLREPRADYDGRDCPKVRRDAMQATLFRAGLAAAVAAALLAGCDRDADRTASQKMDNAAQNAQQKLAEVGDKAAQELKIAGEKTKEAVSQATDKISQESHEAADSAREKTASAASSDTGRVMSDAAITASIKTDYLKDPDLSVLKIDVDTKGGVVTLNGLANDEQARGRAAKLAEGIKGVREVRNFLVVKRA